MTSSRSTAAVIASGRRTTRVLSSNGIAPPSLTSSNHFLDQLCPSLFHHGGTETRRNPTAWQNLSGPESFRFRGVLRASVAKNQISSDRLSIRLQVAETLHRFSEGLQEASDQMRSQFLAPVSSFSASKKGRRGTRRTFSESALLFLASQLGEIGKGDGFAYASRIPGQTAETNHAAKQPFRIETQVFVAHQVAGQA